MKVKDLLWPIVLGVSALVMAISFFLPFIGNDMGSASAFFETNEFMKSPAFASIVSVAYIVGFMAVIALATLALVKAFGGKIPAGKLVALIAGIVAAVAAVAMVVFGLLFMNANKDLMDFVPQIGFYFAAAGLVIGAVSAFLTRKDLE